MVTDIFQTIILPFAVRALLALPVLFVGRWIAKNIQRWARTSLQKTGLTPSLITLITALSYYAILILTGVLILAVMGVPTATLAAIVGIVVVVLAISLQQSLSNLAATIMFLLFKPFVINDVIETAGVLGVVQEIQVFNTILLGFDGKTHILPNGKIQGAGLTNYSKTNMLRLNLTFNVRSRDVEQAKGILKQLLEADARVLAEPSAQVFVQELQDSSVQLAVWPFVRVADEVAFKACFIEQAKQAFDQASIVLPIPQQDVNLFTRN
jgi:small conductance mechanosensitive channel